MKDLVELGEETFDDFEVPGQHVLVHHDAHFTFALP